MVPQWIYTEYIAKKKKKTGRHASSDDNGSILLFSLIGIALLPLSIAFILFVIIADGIVDLYLVIARLIVGKDKVRPPRALQPQIL